MGNYSLYLKRTYGIITILYIINDTLFKIILSRQPGYYCEFFTETVVYYIITLLFSRTYSPERKDI